MRSMLGRSGQMVCGSVAGFGSSGGGDVGVHGRGGEDGSIEHP